jgi:hypothetical protein
MRIWATRMDGIGGNAVMATPRKLQAVPGKLDAPDSGYRSRFEKKIKSLKRVTIPYC